MGTRGALACGRLSDCGRWSCQMRLPKLLQVSWFRQSAYRKRTDARWRDCQLPLANVLLAHFAECLSRL